MSLNKMKGRILIITLVAAFAAANAQEFGFGIKGGLNISSLGGYEYPLLYEDAELEVKAGACAGIFTQIFFTSRIGLETGLYYSILGGEDKERDYGEEYRITANPAYLQLPLSVIYRFRLSENFAVYPSAGIYAGYGLSGKIKTSGMTGSADLTSEVDYFDSFARKYDFGGTVSANLEYRKFVLGFACDRGFIRVNKNKLEYDDNAFNSNFRITLGYIF
jgi:hypothetical protein